MDSAKSFSSSFVAMRNLAMGSLAALVLVTIGAGVLVYRAYESAGQRVYMVTQSGSVAALAAGNSNAHTVFEARNLVSSFMKTMFGHDQYTFKSNLDAAIPWIDTRGSNRIYEGFRKGQVLENYVRYQARNEVDVDSVVVDMEHRPWSGKVYVKQRIFIGGEQQKPFPLAAKFNLIETNRSDANPFGMMITDFDYISYNPTISRQETERLQQQEDARKAALRDAQAAGGGGLAPDAADAAPAAPTAPAPGAAPRTTPVPNR